MKCECGVLGSKDLGWGKPRFQKNMTDRTFYSLKVLTQEKDSKVWSWGLILEQNAEQGRFRRVGWHNAQLGHVYEGGEQLTITLV
jgi:hypothetical protein